MYIHVLDTAIETFTSIEITDETSYLYELCEDFENNRYSILDELERMEICFDDTTFDMFCTQDKVIFKKIKI